MENIKIEKMIHLQCTLEMIKVSLMGSNKSYDLSTHFIENLSIINQYLILNNIFLDKSYDLSTYDLKFVN